MAREEKQANIYAIPKNSFDTGYVFGGQFKTRNFVEGVVVTFPFLGIFLYGWAKLGLDFESTVAYCFILCAAVFVSVVHGVGGDSLFEFIARVVKFRQNRRISKYNPRIKTELEPDYLLHDDTMLPKEKLKRALENIKSKVVGGSDEPISADITDDDLQVYYDDDEDFVEKPDELKSKAELKAEAKQRAKEEKEFIKSLPRNQRCMARAELKRKHKEEAEAAKKREEERERMIQEAIKRRLEKAERVKAAQMRAHLTALERQRVLEQAQPETVDLEEQAAGVTETVLDVVLDEPADTAVVEPVPDAEVSQEDTTAERPDPELTEKGREVSDQSDTVEDVLEDIELDDDTDIEAGTNPSEVLDTSDILDVELEEAVGVETDAQRKPSFEPRVVRNENYTEQIVKPVKVKPQIRSSRDISIFDDEE